MGGGIPEIQSPPNQYPIDERSVLEVADAWRSSNRRPEIQRYEMASGPYPRNRYAGPVNISGTLSEKITWNSSSYLFPRESACLSVVSRG